MTGINKVAVIGSGVMGAGIAAHFANAGVDVVLLDIVPDGAKKDGEDRSRLARQAIDHMPVGRAPQLAHPDWLSRLTPGNLEDDLVLLEECDWVMEVVLEDLAVKQDLYRRIAPHLRYDAVLASNTSTIPLADLTAEMSVGLRQRFVIVHFFNPPRYMRLIELVTGPDTDPAVADRVTRFSDESLGKRVVPCNDRPGFIANRLGGLWMNVAANEAVKQRLQVEEADSILSKPFGVPPTGVFGLMDLIGVDLMERSRQSMQQSLEVDDPQQIHIADLDLFARMTEQGLTGRKSGAGFYRRLKDDDGNSVNEVLDLGRMEWRGKKKVMPLEKGFADFFIDRAGTGQADYAWSVMAPVLCYAAWLVPEITDNPADVDAAMELGYNWRQGPFRLIDRIGARRFVDRLEGEGYDIPPLLQKAAIEGRIYQGAASAETVLLPSGDKVPVPRSNGVVYAGDFAKAEQFSTDSVKLCNMGDGVALLTLTSANGALDDLVMRGIDEALDRVESCFRALVIGGDGTHFSVGANLKKALDRADRGDFDAIHNQLTLGQAVLHRMKYAPFPVVSATSGLALGGGCEILMHSDRVCAALESQIGLVEANVGLIPAWGGTTAMLLRKSQEAGDEIKGAVAAFDVISRAFMGNAAPAAQQAGFLSAADKVVTNRDRLLSDAKQLALDLVQDYVAPEKAVFSLDREKVTAALAPRLAALEAETRESPYMMEIALCLAHVLAGGETGGPLTEQDLHRLEAEGMMHLVRRDKTLARMRHTMTTGKSLKN